MDEQLLLSFEQLEQRHWWFAVRRRIVLDTIATLAPADRARIIEVGCGTGGFMRELARIYPHAELDGVEPNHEAACVARTCSDRPVAVATFDGVPVPDSSADLLIALDVLEHCADDHTSLREAYRVLKPGGALLLTVPALPLLWGPHDEANEHHRRYLRSTLRDALDKAGLAVERITYFNTVLLPLGGIARIVDRLRPPRNVSVELPSQPVNAVLRSVFELELPLLRRADLPVGMSLLAVARRPEAPVDGTG